MASPWRFLVVVSKIVEKKNESKSQRDIVRSNYAPVVSKIVEKKNESKSQLHTRQGLADIVVSKIVEKKNESKSQLLPEDACSMMCCVKDR